MYFLAFVIQFFSCSTNAAPNPNPVSTTNSNDLQSKLTPLQYKVTQENGTEPPFKNEYWNNKKPGVYVDIVSGEPLFSSTHKFTSGTGWPSFYQPSVESNVGTQEDFSAGMQRTEVHCNNCKAHLGHVFPDGPQPTGLRYCINSVSMRFTPSEEE